MNERISQKDLEKLKDYDRLRLEYTRLHEDYRRLLNIPVFSNRRELLIAFFDSVDSEDMEQQRNSKGWKVVDGYLKAIDCY